MATYLFWDPVEDSIVQERDETGALVAEYTTEPRLYGNVISQNQSGAESQFHYDAQGSTLAVTDDNQQVTDTRAYSAFGEATEGAGSTVFPYQYIGRKGYYIESVTNTYLVRSRQYAPSIARWLSCDVLGIRVFDTHLYAYIWNSPVRLIDPSGENGFACEEYFSPIVLFTGAGKKLGMKCSKPEDVGKAVLDCWVDSAGDTDDFAKCMNSKCGSGSYKPSVGDLCEWTSLYLCCKDTEAEGRSDYNPCQCGVDPSNASKTVRKCLSPDGGDKFDSQFLCEDCCVFTLCKQKVQNACELLAKGGKTDLIDLARRAAKATTPSKCFLSCADC